MRFLSRRSMSAVGIALAVLAGSAVGAGPATADPPQAGPATGSDYHPLAPTRVLDTRTGLGLAGGVPAKVGAGHSVAMDLSSLVPDTDSNLTSVVLNVTVTDVTTGTYVTVFRTRRPEDSAPNFSSINVAAGHARANLVTVATSNGHVSFFNLAGTVDVVADVEGYHSANTGGSEFHSTGPTRLLDTRKTTALQANSTRALDLTGSVPAGATAVALNVTGLDATSGTYLAVWPGGPRPISTNVNVAPGEITPNQVVVPVGADGRIDLYNLAGSVDVLVDLAGYYGTDTATTYTTNGPLRVLDTRKGLGTGGFVAPVGQGRRITLDLSGYVPPSTTAVVFNLTGADGTKGTYVTAWPDGQPLPVASSLNLAAGQAAANLVTVAVGPDNKVDLYNYNGSVDLIADLAGYFAPPAAPCSSGCVSGWGDDTGGVIGDRGDDRDDTAPQPLFGLTDVVTVSSEGPNVFALRADGTVWEWGDVVTTLPGGPQCYDPLGGCFAHAPVRVPFPSGVTTISTTFDGMFALRTDGTVWRYGDTYDVTGLADETAAPVAGLTGITAIASGMWDLYALRTNGSVLAMGDNRYGQHGDGTSCANSLPCTSGPVQVSGLTGVTAISGGFSDGFALRSDGTVWSWGYNAKGLNTGTDSGSSTVPLAVNGLHDVTAIATGNSELGPSPFAGANGFGYALRSDGTLWSWGFNETGELGNGTDFETDPGWSFVPTQVSGLTGVTSVSAGNRAGYALLADGSAWAWGTGQHAQLDDGNEPSSRDSPSRMLGIAGATRIFGSDEGAFALFPSR